MYQELLTKPDSKAISKAISSSAIFDVDKLLLFWEILSSHSQGKPIPDWVALEIDAALSRYLSYEVQTLDKAFKIERKPNKSLNAKLRLYLDTKLTRQMQVYQDVLKEREAIRHYKAAYPRRSKKNAANAYAEVGYKHKLSKETVRDWFHAQQRAVNRTKKTGKL